MAASANGHQLGWWLGRAGSCLEPAGLAAPPLPTPGTVPHQPQVSQAARGGREAWLGFRVGQAASLSGPCFLQAPSQTQGRLKSSSQPPQHPHHLPLQQCLHPLGHSSPRAFALAVPLPGALSLNPSVPPSPSGFISEVTSSKSSFRSRVHSPAPLHTPPPLCFPDITFFFTEL